MMLFRQVSFSVGRILLNNLNNSQKTEYRNFKRWVAPTLKEVANRRKKLGPEPLKPRSSFLEWNYEAEVFAFGKRLGEEFKRDILKQALTHRSYVNLEQDKAKANGLAEIAEIPSNQDLIEEGSKIIINYVTAELEKKHPTDVVNSLRDYLTSENMIATIASQIGLKDIILTAEFPVENSTLANTFKAVVEALRASHDLQRAELFVKDFVLSQLTGKDVYDIWNPDKPLEYLTELLKTNGITSFEPRLCNHSATNTILANYQVGLYNEKKLLGIGWGETIDIAKETAALNAIERIYKEKYEHN